MDCQLIEAELIGYHFGALGESERATVEAHLRGCPRCVAAYLEVKHAIENGADAPERPSELARARLRVAAARELGRRRRARWWPAAATALGGLALLVVLLRLPRSPADLAAAGGGGGERAPSRARIIDSARLTPESLDYL